MNLLDALLHPDREDDPQRALITHAANLLQIGEFQLLQLAFADWHGREMTAEEEQLYFRSFVLQNDTPPFLRHYARRIIGQEAEGSLDTNAAAYHRYDNDFAQTRAPGARQRFLVAATIVFGVIGGSIAMASFTVDATGRCTEQLPPCFTQAELGDHAD